MTLRESRIVNCKEWLEELAVLAGGLSVHLRDYGSIKVLNKLPSAILRQLGRVVHDLWLQIKKRLRVKRLKASLVRSLVSRSQFNC